jgi:hypothetical protein
VTTLLASWRLPGFARFFSTVGVCATAALLCPPAFDAVGQAGAPTDHGVPRATQVSSTARAWTIDGTAPHVDAAAVLPPPQWPHLQLTRFRVASENDIGRSSDELRAPGQRGPPLWGAAFRSHDEDDDDEQASHASPASVAAAAPGPAFSSIARRALHYGAGLLSVRAPPQ